MGDTGWCQDSWTPLTISQLQLPVPPTQKTTKVGAVRPGSSTNGVIHILVPAKA